MNKQNSTRSERCVICGCVLHRNGNYAQPNHEARSHASSHHLVAERFFGRNGNRPGEMRDRIFEICPWNSERVSRVFCYECHELLLHNPVLMPEDLAAFADLVRNRDLDEDEKPNDYTRIGGRIRLFHEIIATGLRELLRAVPQ